MKIEEQVVALEVAKELEPCLPEGWESAINWYRTKSTPSYMPGDTSSKWSGWDTILGRPLHKRNYIGLEYISAPTLTEIMLELLPDKMTITQTLPACEDFPEEIPAEDYTSDYHLWLSRHSVEYVDTLGDIALLRGSQFKIDDKTNPATAAAQLYIWLHEQGHITQGGEG